MAWNYQREETSFAPLPEGKYRIRVSGVEKAQSKNGGPEESPEQAAQSW